MAITLQGLQFEIERGSKLLKSTTTLPDETPLGYDGDPNLVINGNSQGDTLLFNAPLGTGFIQQSGTAWMKVDNNNGGVWVENFGSGGGTEVHKYFKYDPVLDQLVATRPITTTLNSLFLGDQHKMSSGAENIFFTNRQSDIDWFPMWGGIKNQQLVENQGKEGIIAPSGRRYSDLLSIEFYGPRDSNLPVVPYQTAAVMPANHSVYGQHIHVGEDLAADDWLFYELYYGTDSTGRKAYEQVLNTDVVLKGEGIEWWFDHPVEGHKGTKIFTQVMLAKGNRDAARRPLLTVASANFPDIHYVQIFLREFRDVDLVDKEDLGFHEMSEAIDGNNHHTLHDGDLQWLTDESGNPLQFTDYANELGTTDLVISRESTFEALHNGDNQFLTDEEGNVLDFSAAPVIIQVPPLVYQSIVTSSSVYWETATGNFDNSYRVGVVVGTHLFSEPVTMRWWVQSRQSTGVGYRTIGTGVEEEANTQHSIPDVMGYATHGKESNLSPEDRLILVIREYTSDDGRSITYSGFYDAGPSPAVALNQPETNKVNVMYHDSEQIQMTNSAFGQSRIPNDLTISLRPYPWILMRFTVFVKAAIDPNDGLAWSSGQDITIRIKTYGAATIVAFTGIYHLEDLVIKGEYHGNEEGWHITLERNPVKFRVI